MPPVFGGVYLHSIQCITSCEIIFVRRTYPPMMFSILTPIFLYLGTACFLGWGGQTLVGL